MSKFVKGNKKIIGIIGVVVGGVTIGVICATSNSDDKKSDKTTVATDTVEKQETDLEKAKKEIKDEINKDYFAKEDGLKVHSKKDNDSKVLKTLKYNESILVYGKTKDNWYVVDVDGEPGYISNEIDPLSSNDIEAKKAVEEAQQAQAATYQQQNQQIPPKPAAGTIWTSFPVEANYYDISYGTKYVVWEGDHWNPYYTGGCYGNFSSKLQNLIPYLDQYFPTPTDNGTTIGEERELGTIWYSVG